MKQENTNNHDSYQSVQKYLMVCGNRFKRHIGSLYACNLAHFEMFWLAVESQILLYRRGNYNLESALYNRQRDYDDNGP